MAVHFTPLEIEALKMSAVAATATSYNDRVRVVEAWIDNNLDALDSALKKLNSPAAVLPEGEKVEAKTVIVEGNKAAPKPKAEPKPAPKPAPPPPAPKKAKTPPPPPPAPKDDEPIVIEDGPKED